jgi:hypothetical protein
MAIIKDIPLHEVLIVFIARHPIALGAGTFGDHQFPRLVGAANHIFLIFRQPFLYRSVTLSHGFLLSRPNSRKLKIYIRMLGIEGEVNGVNAVLPGGICCIFCCFIV